MSETDLGRLLSGLSPSLDEGEYVFCCVNAGSAADHADLAPLATFIEDEGLTLVLTAGRACAAGLPFDGVFRRITLGVHSSLEAVGLTAAVSAALTARGISANVVAACHHDHLFVPAGDAPRALDTLQALSANTAAEPAATTSELYRQRFGLEPGFDPADNPFLRGIMARRSHRHFTAEPVDSSLVQTLLAAAFAAPSKSDLQQACVVRVTDRSKLARIAERDEKVAWITGAPEFMVWCGDSRRIRRLAAWRGHAFANDHLDAFMNAAVDAGIAMQTFIIAAESAGLGCCPVSVIRDHVEALARDLSLPDHVFPVAGLCVGWPAGPGHVSMRLPLSVTVHENTYDDDGLLDEVQDYDRRREALRPTPPDAQLDVDRFGVSADYGWSEHRTRQYARPMRTDFGAFIRRRKFDLS